jgi:hypothetical protein
MLVAAPRGRRGRRLVQRSRSLLCAADLSAGRPVSQPRLERLDGRRPALLHDHERIAGDRAGFDPDEIFVYSESGGYTEWYVLVNCGSGISYWSNNRQCYVSMAPGVPARPPQYDQDAGYVCTSGVLGPGGGVDIDDTYFWSNTVPPGLQVLTPATPRRS